MLLATIGMDPNDQILSIAFAVVEGKTKESWTWFLELLINDLGGTEICRTYTIISDQQKVLFIAFSVLFFVYILFMPLVIVISDNFCCIVSIRDFYQLLICCFLRLSRGFV
jgi:hypothetical protein